MTQHPHVRVKVYPLNVGPGGTYVHPMQARAKKARVDSFTELQIVDLIPHALCKTSQPADLNSVWSGTIRG